MVIRPQTSWKLENFELFVTIRMGSLVRFQRALTHYQAMILSLDTSKKVFCDPNAQIL